MDATANKQSVIGVSTYHLPLQCDTLSSLSALRTALAREIQPLDVASTLHITYLDDDNFRINISTDADLQEALRVMRRQGLTVLEIKVKADSRASTNSSMTQQQRQTFEITTECTLHNGHTKTQSEACTICIDMDSELGLALPASVACVSAACR